MFQVLIRLLESVSSVYKEGKSLIKDGRAKSEQCRSTGLPEISTPNVSMTV